MPAEKRRGRRGQHPSTMPCCGPLVPVAAPDNSMCVNPDECSEMMKALADPNRLRIIRALIGGPSNVTRISQCTGLGAHRVSHHLGRMRLGGLVECSRDGRTIVYRINSRIAIPGGLDLGCSCILFRTLP